MRVAPTVSLGTAECRTLMLSARFRTAGVRLARRAQIVLLAATAARLTAVRLVDGSCLRMGTSWRHQPEGILTFACRNTLF